MSFLGKFGPKKSKLFVLSENWLGTHGILEVQIPNPDIDFWNSDPKIHFWAYLGRRSQSCSFSWKVACMASWRCWFLIPTLVLWISDTKFIFEQIWVKKVKVVYFAWKLVHILSRGCWFLFQHQFSEFQNVNPFLSKFVPKNSKLSSLAENWHTECLDDVDSYTDITFLSFEP